MAARHDLEEGWKAACAHEAVRDADDIYDLNWDELGKNDGEGVDFWQLGYDFCK